MKKKIGLLLGVLLVCMALVSCGADDMPQDGQEMIENLQDEQMLLPNPEDGEGAIENLQDKEALTENPQDEQSLTKSVQDEQALTQNLQDEERLTENSQDEQSLPPNPQDETEEAKDAGYLQYEAFLKNETSVANPYVEGMNLTVMDEKGYETEFEDAQKKYAYVDVNGDDNPELIFKISSYPSELMYILGICDNELVCFDVFETHTKNIAFGVYDYGFVWEVQDYDGFAMTFYTYTADGQRMEARRFTEENEAAIAAYEGEEPEWIDWQ